VDLRVPDISSHGHRDLVEELIDFGRSAFRNQFDATIGQVADESCYGVALGNLPRRIPKANSLDATAKQNAARLISLGHEPYRLNKNAGLLISAQARS